MDLDFGLGLDKKNKTVQNKFSLTNIISINEEGERENEQHPIQMNESIAKATKVCPIYPGNSLLFANFTLASILGLVCQKWLVWRRSCLDASFICNKQ